jgi:hypothetical protein
MASNLFSYAIFSTFALSHDNTGGDDADRGVMGLGS